MSDVAAYHVMFPVQGGMWTGYSQSTIPPCTGNNTWYDATSLI